MTTPAKEDIKQAREAGDQLFDDFSAEMRKHTGLKDVKMKVMPSHETTPGGLMRTVSKVLQAVREGKTRRLTF
jgi:hypothetical protein